MSGALAETLRQGFHRAATPLVWYYAVTLGVPLANGTAQSNAGFVKHAVTVLLVPPIAIVVVCAVYSTVRLLFAGVIGRDPQRALRSGSETRRFVPP